MKNIAGVILEYKLSTRCYMRQDGLSYLAFEIEDLLLEGFVDGVKFYEQRFVA